MTYYANICSANIPICISLHISLPIFHLHNFLHLYLPLTYASISCVLASVAGTHLPTSHPRAQGVSRLRVWHQGLEAHTDHHWHRQRGERRVQGWGVWGRQFWDQDMIAPPFHSTAACSAARFKRLDALGPPSPEVVPPREPSLRHELWQQSVASSWCGSCSWLLLIDMFLKSLLSF